METIPPTAVTYENPPINEVACSVLFNPIKGLQIKHLSALWNEYVPQLSLFEEYPPLPPISDKDFDEAPRMLPIRVWFSDKSENELVQVQFNRFIYNWRKRLPDDVYPGYETVVSNFEEFYSIFQDFLTSEQIGTIAPIQFELTYFDHILENEGWTSLNDLGNIFPNFDSQRNEHKLPEAVRDISWQMLFDLPKDFGRLQLSIESHRRQDNRKLLNLQLTARSGAELYKPMRKWFDIVHVDILQLFVNLVSDEIQEKYWGKQV